MTAPERAPKDGDIFKWSWTARLLKKDAGPFGDYHCKSRVAIAHEGRLLDTYWMNIGSRFISAGWSENRDGASIIHTNMVELCFVANIDSDLVEIRHGEEVYYLPSDVVDLRHANCPRGPVYRRASATRNVGVIREVLERKINETESELRFANARLLRHKAQLGQIIETGDTAVDIF